MLRGYHSFADLPGTMPVFPLTGVLLLPRAALPLNVFEPRYLELVDDALKGNRLIGMIQPTESEETVLRPKLSQVGCAGRIISWRETEDNRYLITLVGLCRFRLKEEISALSAYRQVACDFAPFAGDLAQEESDDNFPRERLLTALKDYLFRRDMKADWKSVMSAPAESLVNALAMMCPFEPAEKQALLEAPNWMERVSTLVALLEISTAGQGPGTLN
ncbi:MAG TPA: LON peptidase substrate-binding domain-containing protein [Rhizomicrobium sp.]|nr:LON peptidase substrate-binding domain-containing protein [Rhizomicrobium sp.]